MPLTIYATIVAQSDDNWGERGVVGPVASPPLVMQQKIL